MEDLSRSNHTVYDVIIVGAGPAGGQCARILSQSGIKVLLLEKAKDFSVNNYSSAGAPLDILETYSLPVSIVGTYWNHLRIASSNDSQIWKSATPKGVVLEFQRLRDFLAEETVKNGGQLLLGANYQKHSNESTTTLVTVKRHDSPEPLSFQCKILVDATGCERNVLAKENYDKNAALVATGIEYLTQVSDKVYQHYANTLSFFMGKEHMPQGYAWIFPMESNHLKIGVGRYFIHDQFVDYHKSYRHYLDQFIQKSYEGEDYQILDKHGKTLYYTYGQRDVYFENNVLAIGDAISTANPLAFEGIRHAMISGNLAAESILQYLKGNKNAFQSFSREIHRYYGIKWKAAEVLAKKIYRADDDKIDLMVKAFKSLTYTEILDLGFNYKLGPTLKFYFLFKYYRLKQRLSWI